MTRLYFMRHGDAYDELGEQLDSYHLNNAGRLQALQLARRLKNNVFDAMYCSKIQRAIDTCAIVNDEHGMDVIYDSGLNEIDYADWPQPGTPAHTLDCYDFDKVSNRIHKTFKKIVNRHRSQEVAIFGHGNWIRVLIAKTINDGNPVTFQHFLLSNTSLTIMDIDENDFVYFVTISDGAHTQLYDSKI